MKQTYDTVNRAIVEEERCMCGRGDEGREGREIEDKFLPFL
jgi:hypothetical protein